MNNQPDIKPGHRAAAEWYADLMRRLQSAGQYLVPSKLAISFADLPTADTTDFLESLAAMIVAEKRFGPIIPGTVWDTEHIRIQSLTPAEQFAYFDAQEEE